MAMQRARKKMVKVRAIRVTYLDEQGRAITKAESQKRMAEVEERIRLANTPRDTTKTEITKHEEKTPPTVLLPLLFWLVSKEQQDAIQGDLNEAYPETLAKLGRWKASNLYRVQVILSILSYVEQVIMRLIDQYSGDE